MANTAAVPTSFQGIPIDPQGVNPTAFQKLTRRKREPEYNRVFAGLGGVENMVIRKSDILSQARIRFAGSLVVNIGTGTATSTSQWPHNLVKNVKLTANGQSNLIDCSGLHLKAREFIAGPDTDRGVAQTVGAASVTQGTLSKASESWGVGTEATLVNGTYDVELEWVLPAAEDDRDLTGAVFCQTATTDIVANLTWAALADLFTLTGNAAVTLTGTVILETEKFSIPVVNGIMVVPDLSLFHSIVESTWSSLATGTNPVRLIGQGAGKALIRAWYRIMNGASPQVPVAVNATNYGQQAWSYGTNEIPETYQDARGMRMQNERDYGVDIGATWGLIAHEFAVRNAFRDTIDMGQTSELRLLIGLNSGLTLNAPQLEYVQETVFAAGP